MKAFVNIDAGICGFRTSACALSDDERTVRFEVTSDCEKIRGLAATLKEQEPLDAYMEIHPEGEGVLMQTVRSKLTGCCAGCAVPVGLFKAMQVAAGLALPRNITIALSKE